LDRAVSLWERLERLPLLVRAPVYGAAFLWFLIGLRGGLIGIPIILLYITFFSHAPATDLLQVVAVLTLATLGGALAGWSYALLGRWLIRLPGGAYAAGILSVAPYTSMAVLIVRLIEGETLLRPPDRVDLVTFAVITVLFGLLLGHTLFRDRIFRDT